MKKIIAAIILSACAAAPLENIMVLETDRLVIRIDEIPEHKYKYSAWLFGSPKPEIIISDGSRIYDGSGGNNYFRFINGDYEYRIYENRLGTAETEPYELAIYKSGASVSRRPVKRQYQ